VGWVGYVRHGVHATEESEESVHNHKLSAQRAVSQCKAVLESMDLHHCHGHRTYAEDKAQRLEGHPRHSNLPPVVASGRAVVQTPYSQVSERASERATHACMHPDRPTEQTDHAHAAAAVQT
jgi:hypothetical protein